MLTTLWTIVYSKPSRDTCRPKIKWSIFFMRHSIHHLLKQIACIDFILALKKKPDWLWKVWRKCWRYPLLKKRKKKPGSDVVIVQCLISFILFVIPEVIMSWILEAATLLPPLHSALTLNGVTVIIAFMHGKVHFRRYLKGLREKRKKKKKQGCVWHEKDGKYLTVSGQNTSVTEPEYKYWY